jgi:hypothetical protein
MILTYLLEVICSRCSAEPWRVLVVTHTFGI